MQSSNRIARNLLFLIMLAGLLAGLVGPRLFSVQAAPVAQAATSKVVISEFRTRGAAPNAGSNEFIEIYNPISNPVNIENWKIRYSSISGSISDRYTFPLGSQLLPGQHFLLVNSGGYSGSTTPDATYTSGLANDGGIAVVDSIGTVVDQVGMSIGSAYKEPADGSGILAPLTVDAEQSYERKVGSANGNCTDSNNNSTDFILNSSSSNPQNLSSTFIPCIAVINITSTIADGIYTIGNIIPVTITFSGIVNVTGAPTLLLETGTTDTIAAYSGVGSGTDTLTFNYTVMAGNISGDLDYVATDSLSLNGGTITCATGDAVLTLPSPGTTGSLGANKAIMIDNGLPPTVTINQAAGQTDPASTLPINFTVIFSEPINVSTFTLADITQSGTATGITWSITDSGNHTNFTLSAAAVTGSGTLVPSIAANLVTDAAGSNNIASTSTDNLVTYTPVSTSTPTGATPTATPAAALSVLINEVAWMGTSSSKANDEWIELYNPGTSSINLNGWKLTVDDGTGEITLATFGAGDAISAGGFFILARANSSGNFDIFTDVTENKSFTEPLVNNPNGQTLRLHDPFNTVIDFANGDRGNWPAGSTSPTYASMERRRREIEGASTWLTFGGTPTKHNRDGALVYGTPGYSNWAVTVLPTATRIPPTRVKTATPVPVGRPIINEYLPRPGFDWNQDGKINVFDEFIEVMNIGPVDININGWRLDVVANQRSTYTFPSIILKPGQRVVFYGLQTNLHLSDGGGTVRLLNSNGQVWDAHTYTIAKEPDKSWCRLPDGTFSWFEDCVPTPSTANTRAGEVPVAPDEDGLHPQVCKLPDTLPADILIAECNGYGANMWQAMFWDKKGWGDQFVPENTSKWNSFVE